jgi:hypothetical protein
MTPIYTLVTTVLFIDVDNYNAHSTITTSRTKLDYGILAFSSGASWEGANDEHLLMYAKTEK